LLFSLDIFLFHIVSPCLETFVYDTLMKFDEFPIGSLISLFTASFIVTLVLRIRGPGGSLHNVYAGGISAVEGCSEDENSN
jgi:hypothetical protein